MKQHITQKQLDDFVKPGGEWSSNLIKCFGIIELPTRDILGPELFTVGKMIEILTNYSHSLNISTEKFMTSSHKEVTKYTVIVDHMASDIFKGSFELCDALWYCVMMELKNQIG